MQPGLVTLGISISFRVALQYKMRFIISCLIVLLAAAVAIEGVNLQVSPSVTYWHEKLPMTAIPESLMELISADQDKKGGVNEGVRKYPRKVGGAPSVDAHNIAYGGAADVQMLGDPSLSMYLLEKDLHTGTKLSLQLVERSVSEKPHFLPRSVANKIPFSSGKISVALKELNIEQGSDTALAMKETLKLCQVPPIEGESKYCATSLESMIDYTTSKLGTNHVSVLITNVPKTSKATMKQQYTVTDLPYQSKSEANSVVCHSQRYAYAVYYCHELKDTRTVQVSLQGEDGSSAEAVAVCHEDTSAWNPKHAALQVLNVKPGGAAVCHIIPQEVLVWLPTN